MRLFVGFSTFTLVFGRSVCESAWFRLHSPGPRMFARTFRELSLRTPTANAGAKTSEKNYKKSSCPTKGVPAAVANDHAGPAPPTMTAPCAQGRRTSQAVGLPRTQQRRATWATTACRARHGGRRLVECRGPALLARPALGPVAKNPAGPATKRAGRFAGRAC